VAEIEKHAVVIPVASVLVQRDSEYALGRGLDEFFERQQRMTPEERRAEWERCERERGEQRAAVRAEQTVDLGSDDAAWVRAAEERQGWPAGYIRHLAQPYCQCKVDRDDGWVFCDHARDLWPEIGR
jgi:hypothetical protein